MLIKPGARKRVTSFPSRLPRSKRACVARVRLLRHPALPRPLVNVTPALKRPRTKLFLGPPPNRQNGPHWVPSPPWQRQPPLQGPLPTARVRQKRTIGKSSDSLFF